MSTQRRSSPPNAPVSLVGAGPGDAGLITWRGVQCLAAADVVLYDYLVNPAMLKHAAQHADLVCLGRHGRDKLWSQADINARLVALAQAGKRVVRLKGGDPAIFGRLAEEVAALEAAGIAYEIVPGITAALAAGSHAGVWITERDVASAVALVTGHESDSTDAPPFDYAALAAFPGTLVFYMGVTTARQWSAALIAGGKPASTPVAVVRRASWSDQTVLRTTLSALADEIERTKMRPPVLCIVGDVVRSSQAMTWFTRRPLFGQRVLLTRPVEQNESLREQFAALGAECVVQPAIEILPPDNWRELDNRLSRLTDFDWLVFSSANGVRAVMERLLDNTQEHNSGWPGLDRREAPAESQVEDSSVVVHRGFAAAAPAPATQRDLRHLAGVKLAVIGPGTAEELAKYHLRADLCPAEEFRAEALAEALISAAAGQRFLLARASRGREVLAEQLRAAGCTVEQVVVYRSVDVNTPDAQIAADLAAGRFAWITVTSSAIARSLVALFGESLRKSRLVSISPITSATLRELGFEPAAEATEYTMDGVVAAVVAAT